jgi:prohibitin 2
MQKTYQAEDFGRYFIHFGIFFILILFGLHAFGTIGAGERGVKLRFGAVTNDVLNEGLYFKIPFVEKVKKINVKIQKQEINSNAASKDLQTVKSLVALNYHVNPESAAKLYQEVGVNYRMQILNPALQESFKASTADFTAEELVTKRPEVREKIKTYLREKLEIRGILIDDFNIVNFEFSPAFDKAIEAKVTAEQEALAAQNKLERVKFEAQQRIEEAKGKAESIRVESEALDQSPTILKLRALEKWNGIMPQVVGGGTLPFINIDLKK